MTTPDPTATAAPQGETTPARPFPVSRLTIGALVGEAFTSLTLRAGRSLLTSAGTLLGVWVVIVVVGLAASAGNQVDARFQRATATNLIVSQEPDPVTVRGVHLPPDADARALAIDGVTAAGHEWSILDPAPTVSTNPAIPDGTLQNPSVEVRAASAGLLAQGRMTVEGTWLGEAFQHSGARVAVVGDGAARDLDLAVLSARPVVFLNGTTYAVIGILHAAPDRPELLTSVMIPTETARREFRTPVLNDSIHAHISVRTGAAEVVGAQLPAALDAARPDRFSVAVPPQTSDLQTTISRDLQALFLLLSGVCLLAGMIGIANTTLVSVMERTGEFGLRRALGARPRHIALQVLIEAALLGGFGGLWGSALGTLTVVAVCQLQGWTAVLSPLVPILGPVLGALVGMLAGLQPALRASRIEPLEALRTVG